MSNNQNTPLIPPEPPTWQKYSPHFEFPMASATSVFLHAFVIGMIVIGGLTSLFRANAEATKPPNMDVIMIEGEGTGFEGAGGEPGLPGSPGDPGPKRTEVFTPGGNESEPRPTPMPNTAKETLPELGVPIIDDGKVPMSSDLVLELARVTQEADDAVKKAMQIPTSPAPLPVPRKTGTGGGGTGNPKGVGGLGGSGGGLGKGTKPGPGTGTGGFGGRKPTDQEIKAWRWRFDLTGDGPEHARKLAAVGVTVAFQDSAGSFFLVTDLNRRPVDMKKDSLVGFKDAVKWYNGKPDSVQALARELQLPFTPKFIVLLLPKERERRLADEERRFADDHRRKVDTLQWTKFDFRLQNGSYDPIVIEQR